GLGLKALVLVTTNDPLVQLHPAVARPGRTWAQVEFGPLPAQEAGDWLAARGADARVEGATTLAELFALVRGEALDAPAKVGFA
ncbi:MAG: ATPase, partial [Actinomycetota bacterium]|nr:ATPase [Actinomycetota bacterium]